MDPFDDLPKRDRNHAIEEMAETAFRRRLVESGAFILQGVDRKDYGSDYQIEVVEDGNDERQGPGPVEGRRAPRKHGRLG